MRLTWVLGVVLAVASASAEAAESTCNSMKQAVRDFTARHAPEATAAQARNWGLLLPARVDPTRSLIVLLHGLDGYRSDCVPIGLLLEQAGFQVAYFGYPGDQPIHDSSALLAVQLRGLRQAYPNLIIDVIAHSMGGLVARDYIEGPAYGGGVDRLIMVAPPNHGSGWARLRFVLSAQENYYLCRSNPDWHWTWMVTEGLGEAGDDLLPKSDFLKQLNARPRRAGVRYTIIAGNKSRVDLVEANCLASCSQAIPARARGWWGLRQFYQLMQDSARNLRTETGPTDGPVLLKSARLKGVSDFVVLPADHAALYLPIDQKTPASWDVIRSRLSR